MTGESKKMSGFPPELALDSKPGPAAHLSQAKADAMIETALLAAGFDAAPVATVTRLERPVEKHGRRMAFWQAAAAVLIAFAGLGSASAAVVWFARSLEPKVEQLPVQRSPRKIDPSIKRAPVEAPAIVPAPIAVEELELNAPADDKTRTRKPEDWLEEANRLRAQKRWQAADESYARVWLSSPHSDAAYVARVASAGVRLDHLHDPRAALARYKSALKVAPNGPLSEEARYGISEAYRSLGEAQAELRALRDFLTRHPNAGLTNKAKQRMLELEARP